jgi:hypothetical protein
LSSGLQPDRFLIGLAVLGLLSDAAGEHPLAGASQDALRLLASAAAGPLDALDRGRLTLLHGQIEVDLSHGVTALPLLLDAARQLEPQDQ